MKWKKFLKIVSVIVLAIGLVFTLFYVYNNDTIDTQNVSFNIESVASGYTVEQQTNTSFQNPIIIEFEYEGTVEEDRFNEIIPKNSSIYIGSEKLSSNNVKRINLYYDDERFQSREITEDQNSLEYKGKEIYTGINETVKLNVSEFVENPENINSYVWDTKRDIIQNKQFNETYTIEDTYNATLTVTDKNQQETTYKFNIIVEESQSVVDSIQLEKDVSDELVLSSSRINHGERNPVEYIWEMGDGTLLTGETVSHKYKTNGLYNVTLTVKYQNADNRVENLIVNSYIDLSQIELNESKPIISEKQGYKFNLSTSVDTRDDYFYEWKLGNGDSVESQINTINYKYDKYGVYNITLNIKTPNNRTVETYNTTVETEVIIEFDNQFAIESISGDHDKILLENDDIGDPIPTMNFQQDHQYVLKNIPQNIDFVTEDGKVLLSQNTDGSMEDNDKVNWIESDNSVEFTVTRELGEKLYGYKIP